MARDEYLARGWRNEDASWSREQDGRDEERGRAQGFADQDRERWSRDQGRGGWSNAYGAPRGPDYAHPWARERQREQWERDYGRPERPRYQDERGYARRREQPPLWYYSWFSDEPYGLPRHYGGTPIGPSGGYDPRWYDGGDRQLDGLPYRPMMEEPEAQTRPADRPYEGNRADYRGDYRRARYGHAGKGPQGYKRSDDRITEDVCEMLTRHPEIDASHLSVRCEGGEIVLSGTVNDRRSKRMAEDLAERVSGVTDVRNEIRVSRENGS